MSEEKHTPGPWIASHDSRCSIGIYGPGSEGNRTLVASVGLYGQDHLAYDGEDQDVTTERDRHVAVILASPVLLTACKALRARLALARDERIASNSPIAVPGEGYVDVLDAAIALAERAQ